MLPSCAEFGIQRDMHFTGDIVVERKASLEELSGNLSKYRERFESEFLRAKDCNMTLLVERGSLTDIFDKKYNTQLSNKAFIASLIAWQQRYNIKIEFINMQHAGALIYSKFYYHLREFLII